MFVVGPSQKKTISDTPKMENGFFIQLKKTSFVNIVRATKMHDSVQYGSIKTNYAMYLAITPIISTETLEC